MVHTTDESQINHPTMGISSTDQTLPIGVWIDMDSSVNTFYSIINDGKSGWVLESESTSKGSYTHHLEKSIKDGKAIFLDKDSKEGLYYSIEKDNKLHIYDTKGIKLICEDYAVISKRMEKLEAILKKSK